MLWDRAHAAQIDGRVISAAAPLAQVRKNVEDIIERQWAFGGQCGEIEVLFDR
jgi:hypothetical protein